MSTLLKKKVDSANDIVMFQPFLIVGEIDTDA